MHSIQNIVAVDSLDAEGVKRKKKTRQKLTLQLSKGVLILVAGLLASKNLINSAFKLKAIKHNNNVS